MHAVSASLPASLGDADPDLGKLSSSVSEMA